jgi:dihydroorotate dehydrogenase
MTLANSLSRYDRERSYRWNYDHPPDPVSAAVTELDGKWSFAGLPASGPLGVAAGPLLNGAWVLYYASLGFDVLTYKTVRSGARECYPMPNLVHVPDHDRVDGHDDVTESDPTSGSWAVSFGMPSSDPSTWRDDVRRTRERLSRDKRLSVSVVGTDQPGWSIEDLAADYARCARWAREAGADAVEANLSCPNVSTCDGDLYARPRDARIVSEAIRDAIGDLPLILKVGHLVNESAATELLRSIAGSATAVAMTNSVPGRVRDRDGAWLFEGQRRGICGAATLQASLDQVRCFARLIAADDLPLRLIGVGGVSTAQHVARYLAAGAESVQLATAAMLDPAAAIRIKSEMAGVKL